MLCYVYKQSNICTPPGCGFEVLGSKCLGPAGCHENNLSVPIGTKITEDMDCDVSCAGKEGMDKHGKQDKHDKHDKHDKNDKHDKLTNMINMINMLCL